MRYNRFVDKIKNIYSPSVVTSNQWAYAVKVTDLT